MNESLVSIIVPTYYRESSLENAIESAVDQTYDEIEVIVVDDSGEKFAESTVRKYDVTYISHDSNKGGNPARNTGYQASQGEYIQFLDDDDTIYPEKIERQVELIESSDTVGVAYAGLIDENNKELYPEKSEPTSSLGSALQLFWPATITSSLLIRSNILSEIYPLRNRKAADDIGMKIELAKRTEFGYVDQILTNIGDSEESRSVSADFAEELMNIYAEYEEEYDKLPDEVRQNALSAIYRTKGNMILIEKKWSPAATHAYLLAIVYSRKADPVLIGSFVLSLFGSPGMRLGSYLRRAGNAKLKRQTNRSDRDIQKSE